MALITRYVNTASTAGGDGTTNATAGANRAYATLQECETNEQADFVTDTDNLVVHWSGSTADVFADFDGSTTSSTFDIVVNGDNSGGLYDTSKARIERTVSANFHYGLRIADPNVTINNLQVQMTNSGGYSEARSLLAAVAGTITINDPVIKGVISAAGSIAYGFRAVSSVTDVNINNAIIYDFVNGSELCAGLLVSGANADCVSLYNGPIINCYYGSNSSNFQHIHAVNVITQNCTDGFIGTHGANSDYNLSDISSDAPGANSVTATLTFNDAPSDDYHLASGDTAAIGAGVGPSTDANVPTTDVDGDARSGTTCDIGFDEYVAAGGTILPFMMNYA